MKEVAAFTEVTPVTPISTRPKTRNPFSDHDVSRQEVRDELQSFLWDTFASDLRELLNRVHKDVVADFRQSIDGVVEDLRLRATAVRSQMRVSGKSAPERVRSPPATESTQITPSHSAVPVTPSHSAGWLRNWGENGVHPKGSKSPPLSASAGCASAGCKPRGNLQIPDLHNEDNDCMVTHLSSLPHRTLSAPSVQRVGSPILNSVSQAWAVDSPGQHAEIVARSTEEDDAAATSVRSVDTLGLRSPESSIPVIGLKPPKNSLHSLHSEHHSTALERTYTKIKDFANSADSLQRLKKQFSDIHCALMAHVSRESRHGSTCSNLASSDHLGESTVKMALRVMVKSEVFDYAMGFLLVLNALAIGLQTDYMANHPSDEVPTSYRIIQIVFCVCFSVELLLRLYVYRSRFLHMQGWQWNLFDLLVVIFQVIDELTQLVFTGSAVQEAVESMGVLRMLRVVRIVRLIRMVRLIPELKNMAYLISASMWSFFWTVVLLWLLIYCVAVYFTEIANDFANKHSDDALEVNAMQAKWGSVWLSTLSLYMAITGGDDWRNFTDVFQPFSYGVNVTVFSMYIAFATLVMLNLVTGVFVEGAQRIIKEDKDSDLIKQACKLFVGADTDKDHDINWREFQEQVESKNMDEYFKAVDLTHREGKELFKLLDVDGSGTISVEEFVRGCVRLRGPARSVDLAALVYDFKYLCEAQENRQFTLEDSLSKVMHLMEKALDHLNTQLQPI